MRSNHNPEGSGGRGVAGKLGLTAMPMEWLDAGSWRLPSGKALAEFALQAGFLAPLLFQTERPENGAGLGAVKHRALRAANKQFGRGTGA